MAEKLRKVVSKINPQAESYNDIMSLLMKEFDRMSPSD